MRWPVMIPRSWFHLSLSLSGLARKNSTLVSQRGCRQEKIQKFSLPGHTGEELLQFFLTGLGLSCQNLQIPRHGDDNLIIIPCLELLVRKKSSFVLARVPYKVNFIINLLHAGTQGFGLDKNWHVA